MKYTEKTGLYKELNRIVTKILNVQPFATGENEETTIEDLITTIRYNLSHGWKPLDKGVSKSDFELIMGCDYK